MKKMSQVAPQMLDQLGAKVSFAQYLEDQAGSGELFRAEIGELLWLAVNPQTEWAEADEYLAPIARQIISEAVQLQDKRIYLRLVFAIREAWQELHDLPRTDKVTDREFVLDPADPDFSKKCTSLLHDLTFARSTVKESFQDASGVYRIVAGHSSA